MTGNELTENEATPGLYFAAPLFSDAEREFNDRLKSALEPFFDVYLPQDDGDLLVDLIDEGIDRRVAIDRIFSQDVRAIREADVLLVVLDGRAIDEGASFELGLAYAEDRTCIGLQTDPRRLLPTGNNPMIEASCDEIFDSVDALVDWAREFSQREETME